MSRVQINLKINIVLENNNLNYIQFSINNCFIYQEKTFIILNGLLLTRLPFCMTEMNPGQLSTKKT